MSLLAGNLSVTVGWPNSKILRALPRCCASLRRLMPLRRRLRSKSKPAATMSKRTCFVVASNGSAKIAPSAPNKRSDSAEISTNSHAGLPIKDSSTARRSTRRLGDLKERYPRGARYFHLSHDQNKNELVAEFDAEKHAKAERLDGCYVLKTSRKDLSGDELWRIYVLLTRAENAFRDLKSPLAERPIFHQLEHRVEAHIFLCLLAYHLLISIEKTLVDKGIHSSWKTVREALKTHQICTVVLPTSDGSCLRIRKAATPDPEIKELYDQLGISPDIMKAQHKPNFHFLRHTD